MTLEQILTGIADLYTFLQSRLAGIEQRLDALETSQQSEPGPGSVPRDPQEDYLGAHHHHEHQHPEVGVIHHHDPATGDALPGTGSQ